MATDRGGPATSRLTVDDWVQAGFAILAEEGITALKIDRLCSRLDVTKGSFYWHFTDIAGYRATLIEAWGELSDDDRSHFKTCHLSAAGTAVANDVLVVERQALDAGKGDARVGPNRRSRHRHARALTSPPDKN